MLAPSGVPVIYNPKSALIINVTIWDDAAAKKLNPEVKQFTVFETTTGDTFLLGSGRSRTKEEQLQGLSRNAVRQIENWMVEMRRTEGWFDAREGAATEARVPRAGVGATATAGSGTTAVKLPDATPEEG